MNSSIVVGSCWELQVTPTEFIYPSSAGLTLDLLCHLFNLGMFSRQSSLEKVNTLNKWKDASSSQQSSMWHCSVSDATTLREKIPFQQTSPSSSTQFSGLSLNDFRPHFFVHCFAPPAKPQLWLKLWIWRWWKFGQETASRSLILSSWQGNAWKSTCFELNTYIKWRK